jgi:3-oxoadipate enol-lactonase
MFTSLEPGGYAACCAAIRDMDLRSFASLNRLPTLIIAGSEDQATPLSDARFLSDANSRSDLLVLPAAHLSNLECGEAFTTHMLAALKEG